MERKLRTTRRQMLRKIFRMRRKRIDVASSLNDESNSSSNSSSSSSSDDYSSESNSEDDDDSSVNGAFLDEEALEPWSDWLQRTALHIQNVMKHCRSDDWVMSARRRKWLFAGQTARQTDNRWNTRLLKWIPKIRRRSQQRPCTRWEDCLTKVAGGTWMEDALDVDLWSVVQEGYVMHQLTSESF